MKYLRLFFLVAVLISIPFTSCLAGESKTKIGIMKFKVSQNLDPGLGVFLYESLMEKIVNSGKFTVVDWEEIDRVLSYIAKSQPNISEEAARKQAINQLGIRKMYIGSLNKIGKKYYVSIKVLNLDLTIERVEKLSVSSEDELELCITNLAGDLFLNRDEVKARRKTQAEAERKKEEEERSRLEAKKGKEIGRDGRFVANSLGFVIDTQTGLMWAAKDNGCQIAWNGAKSYCESFRGADYADWRMPTSSELAELYGTGEAYLISSNPKRNAKITNFIKITSSYLWASDTDGINAAVFSFHHGRWNWVAQSYSAFRALPVRFAN